MSKQIVPEREGMMDELKVLNPNDLKIDAISNYPPCTGVRITHLPTGLSVTCDSSRWMVENRAQAIRELEAILEGNNNAG